MLASRTFVRLPFDAESIRGLVPQEVRGDGDGAFDRPWHLHELWDGLPAGGLAKVAIVDKLAICAEDQREGDLLFAVAVRRDAACVIVGKAVVAALERGEHAHDLISAVLISIRPSRMTAR
jgi:hypothetical protein